MCNWGRAMLVWIEQRVNGQVFFVWQVSEKHLANGKDLFWAFIDLKNALI